MSNVSLHRSYEGSTPVLPNFYLKRGFAKCLKYTPVQNREECIKSSLYSLVWSHARITKGKQRVPSCRGFYELVSKPDLDQITVGHLPPLPFSPKESKVIAAEIRRTQDIRKELETDFIFIEADQALYTEGLDVMFALKNKGEDLFPTIILHRDDFYIGMHMLRTINSLFKRCGIAQLFSSAGFGVLGTVKKALTGADVKEGINLHKKLCEALLRTKIKYINASKCDERNVIEVSHANKKEQYITIDKLRKGDSRETFENVIVSGNIELLPNSAPGDMGWLMDIYIEMVDMLLNYIHFLRTGNWKRYLDVLFDFPPHCFRLHCQNYTQNKSYYYVHM